VAFYVYNTSKTATEALPMHSRDCCIFADGQKVSLSLSPSSSEPGTADKRQATEKGKKEKFHQI